MLVSTFPQQSLEEQLQCPSCLLVDFAKLEVPSQMHVAFLALHQFIAAKGALPGPRYVCVYVHTCELTLYICTYMYMYILVSMLMYVYTQEHSGC